MKYTPVQPPEGINVTPEHPLKPFFILTAGTIGLVLIAVIILGFAADHLVGYIPIEYEQSLFGKEKVYIMPFPSDSSAEGEKVQHYLQTLVNQLHSVTEDNFSKHQFTVAVTALDDANAFAVPGGHIVVTRGLLQSVESENGLSMVLAHEMAHHYERHPLRSTGRSIVVGLFLLALVGADGSDFVQQFLGPTASIANLAFSRNQEASADETATDLLLKYYGHASGAAEFFQSIQNEAIGSSKIPNFLNTHPSTEDRIRIFTELEKLHSGEKKPLPKYVKDYAVTSIP